ncbi:hypothetical protein, partial [Angustibacter peucedani]
LLALETAAVVVRCGAVLLAGRRAGVVATGAALLGAEAGLHAWFSLTTGAACTVTDAFTGHHHAAASCLPAVTGATTTAPAAATTSAGPLMLGAHLVAVLVTAAVLAHGEALLWRLAGLARTRLVRLGDPVRVVVARALAPVAALGRPRRLALPTAVGRRGPPAVAVG